MAHARQQHPNAVLTPTGRARMVACVIEDGWTIEATAERFQVDAKTVRKWRDRFLTEGAAGLCDRSSRPHSSPNQTRLAIQRRVVALRCRHRWGAAHIGHELGVAPSTVQAILHREGLGRLDPVTGPPPTTRCVATSGSGPGSWSMSTSRRSPASRPAAAGASTAAAKHPP